MYLTKSSAEAFVGKDAWFSFGRDPSNRHGIHNLGFQTVSSAASGHSTQESGSGLRLYLFLGRLGFARPRHELPRSLCLGRKSQAAREKGCRLRPSREIAASIRKDPLSGKIGKVGIQRRYRTSLTVVGWISETRSPEKRRTSINKFWGFGYCGSSFIRFGS